MTQLDQGETEATSVRIVRTLGAPPDRVWAAFADTALVARWFAPGTREPRIETWDLQEGGAYRFTMVPTEDDGYGGPRPVHGRFLRVDPERELVLAWNWDPQDADDDDGSVLTFRLRPTEDGTELALLHEGLAPPSVGGTHAGWTFTLPRLEALLA